MISVLLADDQDLVRAGLRTILEQRDGIEVVGEAADGDEAVREARRLGPDVVLMDVRMPKLDGIAATRELTGAGEPPRPRVLVLTTFDLDDYVYEALRAGASGFLLKDVTADRLVAAIHAVRDDDTLLSPVDHAPAGRALCDVARRRRRRCSPGRPHAARARGPHAGGARALELRDRRRARRQPATVKTHVGRVLMKLDARDRVQAVIFAYETGVIRPGGPG